MKTYKLMNQPWHLSLPKIHISCLIWCCFRTFLLNYTFLENGYIVYSDICLQTLHGQVGARNKFLEKVWVGSYIRVKNKFSNGYMIIDFCLELIIVERMLKIWKTRVLIFYLLRAKTWGKLPKSSSQPTFFLCTN